MKSAYAATISIRYVALRTARSGGGTVDFQEFVGGLSAFSSRGGREEKLRCATTLLTIHTHLSERLLSSRF